jgi:hypothetical protein
VRKCILTRSAPDVVDLPNGFYLGENYSNPFSPVTTIEFGLPEPSDVRLTIYNMLGRRVKVLVDERRTAGRHRVRRGQTRAACA